MIALLLGLTLRCGDSFHLRWMAAQSAIPPTRFEAIARVESGCNLSPTLRGRRGEWGRFQIRPALARFCIGWNTRTYAGNTECALWLLDDAVRRLGLTDATRHWNGSGPKTFEYLYHVLKREESL